jgi:outer membrane lipoprotein-sorting protein
MRVAALRAVIGTLLLGALHVEASPSDALEIARKLDDLYRSSSSFSEVEMEIVTPDWTRTLDMQVWTAGTDKTLARILAPKKDRGVGTLRLGSEMWNYFPRVNKIMKIPPSMMMSSWMGSDFTNDDLVREFTLIRDFDFRLVRPDGAQNDLLYLEAKPKEGVPVVWSRILAAVRAADLIPVWEQYFDDKDRLIRRLDFTDVSRFGSREVPATLTLLPANKKGHKTVLRYKIIEFDRPVDDSIMTLRNLRSFD